MFNYLIMRLPFTLIIIVTSCLLAWAGWRLMEQSPQASKPQFPKENISLKALLDSTQTDSAGLIISITKGDLRLSVLDEDSQIVKTYPVVFGENPTDDKLMQGDKCTPEGVFHIKSSYPHNSWSYFAWIDYPTEDSWRKHSKAKAEGRIPQSASIGGEIGIHGVPAGYDYVIKQRHHWTLGCISMQTKDIEELFPYLQAGRTIVIEK